MVLVHANELIAEGADTGVQLKSLFTNEAVKFGIVNIPAGARILLHETSAHEQDEYSYVVKGTLIIGIGNKEYCVKTGDATLIPAGEPHWSFNDRSEEATIV